ncbi:hypothetical protein LB505_014300 [Fusarium chuoi]|nr:hypothetical protein LB505_014300 [Fusarium chuoi]
MEVVTRRFERITQDFNTQTSQNLTPEEVASGFLNIANETMSRPIRNATEARGFAPESHDLVSFGGAACDYTQIVIVAVSTWYRACRASV